MNQQVATVEVSNVEALNRSEIEMQITTARKYPRDVAKVQSAIVAHSILDEETAASCFYTIPRAGKEIQGPSVRLAEIALNAWGNARVSTYIVEVGDTHVTAEAAGIDLETNVGVKLQVRRRITDRNGNRYNDDMIGVTANAAKSVAYRECVFKIVPRTYVDKGYRAAHRTAIGDESKLPERRQKMLKRFSTLGVDTDMLLGYLGRNKVDDVGTADLEKAIGVYNALADGDISVEETFSAPVESTKRKPGRPKSTAKQMFATLSLKAKQTLGDEQYNGCIQSAETLQGKSLAKWNDDDHEAANKILSEALKDAEN